MLAKAVGLIDKAKQLRICQRNLNQGESQYALRDRFKSMQKTNWIYGNMKADLPKMLDVMGL